MLLTLARQPSWHATTLGVLFIDGVRECYTLENQTRPEGKIYGKTAIPAGRYQVVIAPSPAFGRDMPRLLDVPGFEGILIHWGTTRADTLGCIITGSAVADAETVTASRAAFDALFWKLVGAVGEVWIEVREAG